MAKKDNAPHCQGQEFGREGDANITRSGLNGHRNAFGKCTHFWDITQCIPDASDKYVAFIFKAEEQGEKEISEKTAVAGSLGFVWEPVCSGSVLYLTACEFLSHISLLAPIKRKYLRADCSAIYLLSSWLLWPWRWRRYVPLVVWPNVARSYGFIQQYVRMEDGVGVYSRYSKYSHWHCSCSSGLSILRHVLQIWQSLQQVLTLALLLLLLFRHVNTAPRATNLTSYRRWVNGCSCNILSGTAVILQQVMIHEGFRASSQVKL
jgi:hypothetical protein